MLLPRRKQTHLITLRVPHRLIHTQDQRRRLDSTTQRIRLDERGFPHKLFEIITDALGLDVDAGPDVALGVLHPELVEDVGRVEAGIVADLSGDDFERFGEGADDELLLAHDCARVLSEVF